MLEIFTLDNTIALITLTALEIVLGIDNLVVIAILIQKLEKDLHQKARLIGLSLAMIFRVIFLLGLSWIMMLNDPIFHVMSHGFSGRDLLLLAGGLFLITKATLEIHKYSEGEHTHGSNERIKKAKFSTIIFQILVVDIIFSIDSVITAIGMAEALWVMITSVIFAMIFMLLFTKIINEFIDRHPTLKMLALSFILLVGVMLVADGLGKHVERGYIYFAMGFSLFVEVVNIRSRKVKTQS